MLKSITNQFLSMRSQAFIKNASHCLKVNKRSFCRASSPLLQEGPVDYGYADPDPRFKHKLPTIEYAKLMPNHYSAMRHEQILQLCVEGNYCARREALIRNVMGVDSIEYQEAEKVVAKISASNKRGMVITNLPYKVGFGVSLAASVVSFPMIFDLDTILFFNERYITADVPEHKDLETIIEVAAWSWGLLQPIFGQISFVLLALQFARNQALNLGMKPYGDWMKNKRANYLVSVYPQYDEVFVRWYSEGQTLYGSKNLGTNS